MALAGSGTDFDPWLITTMSELLAVLRDSGGSGHYRITRDLGSGYFSLVPITTTVGAGYAAKVIDGDGFAVRFAGTQPGSGSYCVFSGIHFKNIEIHYALTLGGNYTNYLFYRCSLTDVAVYGRVITSYAVITYLVWSDASTPFIIPRELKRVALLADLAPATAQFYFLNVSFAGVTPSQMYVYTDGSPSTGLTKRTAPLTVAILDSLTSNAFSDNGWWQSGVNLTPKQAEQVALTLQTIADGANASRRLWLESEKYTQYIGDTDVAGVAQLNVRIHKWASFTVIASEDYGADELRASRAVVAGGWYLPPTDNGFVYQAGADGRVTSLAGVVFNAQPVTVDGVVFTPRPVYRSVMSARSSVQRGGAAQLVVLNNASGGGEVIEGDPAFLDGVVDEVHPMLGTARPLAHAEVYVFERRGSEFVPMGSAYSNSVGEFRVETDVYGGGDVFAFTTDFPGVTWQAGIALSLGDRVRPTVDNGYVYEVVVAGNSGGDEPQWWADEGDGTEGYIGGARAKAKPYYQPVGHGPLKMTFVTP